jgi:hypothetical protein
MTMHGTNSKKPAVTLPANAQTIPAIQVGKTRPPGFPVVLTPRLRLCGNSSGVEHPVRPFAASDFLKVMSLTFIEFA